MRRTSLLIKGSLLVVAAVASMLTVSVVMAQAGGFAAPWAGFTSGGSQSTGGQYGVNGSLGQTGVGSPMTGGLFGVNGGVWPGTPEQMQQVEPPALEIAPASTTVVVGTTVEFTPSGGDPPYVFSLHVNNSGGAIVTSTGEYSAGATGGVVDTVRVTDADGAFADAFVNVEEPSQEVVVSPEAPAVVRPGERFDVDIVADSVASLAGADLDVTYDQGSLAFVTTTRGPDFEQCVSESDHPADGMVGLSMVCQPGRSGVDLVLWSLTFEALQDVTASRDVTITTENVELGSDDDDPQHVPAAGGSAIVSIVPGDCGDADGNGRIDIIDAIIALQIVVGRRTPTSGQSILLDINGDGEIAVGDVVALLRHLVGRIPHLDACGAAPVDQSE